jgi:hypothetical protein
LIVRRRFLHIAGSTPGLLGTAAILPFFVLGPLGPGTLLIHHHHEHDIHTHRVVDFSVHDGGHSGTNAPVEHGTCGCIHDEHHHRTDLLIVMPDLYRSSLDAIKHLELRPVVRCPEKLPTLNASPTVSVSVHVWDARYWHAPREPDTLTKLLLSSNALLI